VPSATATAADVDVAVTAARAAHGR
jgi:hypothetical protein